MKISRFAMEQTPIVIYGEETDRAFLFFHWENRNCFAIEPFAELALAHGWQVVDAEMAQSGETEEQRALHPWQPVLFLKNLLVHAKRRWENIGVFADSVGAWLCMLAFEGAGVERCLFLSPVLDMADVIASKLDQAGITPAQLRRQKTVSAGEYELTYDYFRWLQRHRAHALCENTAVLLGGQDPLVSKSSVQRFVGKEGAIITTLPGCDHWFETERAQQFAQDWARQAFSLWDGKKIG